MSGIQWTDRTEGRDVFLSFHSGRVMETHVHDWGGAYQEVLGTGICSPVSLSAPTGIAGLVAVAPGGMTVFQGLSAPPGLP